MPDRVIKGLNGPRGTFLLTLSGLSFAHALSVLPNATDGVDLPFGLDMLNEAVPLGLYAIIWFFVTAITFFAAFKKRNGEVREGADIVAFGVNVGVYWLWSITYFLGWVFEPTNSRQWLFALLYVIIGGLVAAAARMRNPMPSQLPSIDDDGEDR